MTGAIFTLQKENSDINNICDGQYIKKCYFYYCQWSLLSFSGYSTHSYVGDSVYIVTAHVGTNIRLQITRKNFVAIVSALHFDNFSSEHIWSHLLGFLYFLAVIHCHFIPPPPNLKKFRKLKRLPSLRSRC